jgi:hypothetical protein
MDEAHFVLEIKEMDYQIIFLKEMCNSLIFVG